MEILKYDYSSKEQDKKRRKNDKSPGNSDIEIINISPAPDNLRTNSRRGKEDRKQSQGGEKRYLDAHFFSGNDHENQSR